MSKKFLFAAIVLVFSGNYAFAANTYDAEGKITRKENSDGSYSEYVYNSWDNVYETVYSSTGEIQSRNFYWARYDSSPSGTFTETVENGETIRSADTGYSSSYVVSFNAAGQQTSGVYYQNGEVESKETCSYNGNEMTRLAYWGYDSVANQTPSEKMVFNFNDAGAKTSQSSYDVTTDQALYKTAWDYDQQGHLIMEAYYDSPESIINDSPDEKMTAVYEAATNSYYVTGYHSPESIASGVPDEQFVYNENNNSRIFYRDGKLDHVENGALFFESGTGSFIYDESGNLVGMSNRACYEDLAK